VPAGHKKWVRLAALAIILAGTAAYFDSLSGQLLFDDPGAITDNPSIHSLWPPWRCLQPPPETTVSARPFVNFTLAINYALSGEDLRGYHVLNLIVHVLAGLTLLGIVRRSLAGAGAGVPALSRHATPLATIAALVWMLHPIGTESVSYLVQRTESLMGLMYLLTLYCAIRVIGGGGRGWTATATACCALGMAAKEVMVTAPILVLLYDRALAAGSFRNALRRRRGLYLALASTWAVLAACMLTGTRAQSAGFHLGVSAWDYLKTQAGVILQYLRVALWPDELVFDYYWRIAQSPWQWAPQGIAMLLLLALTAVGVWRNRPWGFLGAWFFLILGPTSSFFPIVTEIAAEHRMYLPLAAIVCGAVVGAFHCGDLLVRPGRATPAARRGLAVVGILASMGVIGTLGILTALRNLDYYSAKNLWTDTVLKRPDNPRALSNLGNQLEHEKDYDGALWYYLQAKKADPTYVLAMSNAGSLLVRTHHPQDALAYLHDVIRLSPAAPGARNNLGVALMELGRPAEAVPSLRAAVELDGNNFEFHANLATAATRLQWFDEALREYGRAIQLAPKEATLNARLNRLLIDIGRYSAEASRAGATTSQPATQPQAPTSSTTRSAKEPR
jgi:Flp pilus assembly protein TadD